VSARRPQVPGRPAEDADPLAVWGFATALLGGDRWADMFSVDGVVEMPFAPEDLPLPRRIEGREEIRRIMHPVQRRAFGGRTVEVEVRAAHHVSDELVVVEFTTHIRIPGGADHAVPYVHVVRVVDGELVLLRDYAPFHLMQRHP
jgi:ketosteroid isomerase-like protein